MHEASLARAMLSTVMDSLDERSLRGQDVVSITVRIGELAQIDPESLEFAFSFAAAETELEGCKLIFTTAVAELLCVSCQRLNTYDIEHLYRCVYCGGPCDLISGKEFDVISLELAGSTVT